MQIDLTPAARQIIARLLKTGLYGTTEADVCERLFYEKLREIKDDPENTDWKSALR